MREQKKVPAYVKVFKDIQKLQPGHKFLIRKHEFQQLLAHTTSKVAPDTTVHWSRKATEAAQHSAEEFLVGFFEDSNLCCAHSKRQTLLVKDMRLARRIRGRYEESLLTG